MAPEECDHACGPSPFGVTLAFFRQDSDGYRLAIGKTAYTSNESGRLEVYVAPFPGPGGKWQVSTAGGTVPRWRGDGKEIFYSALDGRLMAAAVGAQGSGFEVGEVRPLFAIVQGGPRFFYDVSRDGQRVLVNSAVAQNTAPSPITVVVNWLNK